MRPIETRDAGEEGLFYEAFHLSNHIVLIKSCRSLEAKYVDYLSTLCERKVVPTGPLITFAGSQETGGSEIMDWLTHRPQGSTLYISFGSENYLSHDQMREIAKGLELSDVNFIWVAREPAGTQLSIQDALPQGFLQRANQRGLLIQGWAPQAAILAHPSVGAFLSHCGWSSVIESLYFGVPLVALPLKLDQPFNARLLVEAGVGVEVVRDQDGGIDGNRVAGAVKAVLLEKNRETYRSKAREMGEKMQKEGEGAFHQVAQELTKICNRK